MPCPFDPSPFDLHSIARNAIFLFFRPHQSISPATVNSLPVPRLDTKFCLSPYRMAPIRSVASSLPGRLSLHMHLFVNVGTKVKRIRFARDGCNPPTHFPVGLDKLQGYSSALYRGNETRTIVSSSWDEGSIKCTSPLYDAVALNVGTYVPDDTTSLPRESQTWRPIVVR
jgi:hypothetical protein